MKTKLLDYAKEGNILKLICGAAVQNPDDVLRCTFIATMANVSIVDVSYSMVGAAVKGRSLAEQKKVFKELPLIMASISNPGDPHFFKIEYKGKECDLCNKCVRICPNNAISNFSNKIQVDKSMCRGCGHCLETCHLKNFEFKPMNMPTINEAIIEAKKNGADMIELHLSGQSPQSIAEILESTKADLDNVLLSVCIGSQLSSPKEISQVLKVIVEYRKGIPTFIQADGNTMKGDSHGIAALAIAELILSHNFPDIYVICSGGCGPLTWRIARLASLPIAGIGMGIAFRERIAHLINSDSLLDSPNLWKEAEDIGGIIRGQVTGNEEKSTRDRILKGVALLNATEQAFECK